MTKLNETTEQKIKVISKNEISASIRNRIEKDLRSFVKIYDQKFGPASLKEFRITIKELNKEGTREEYEVHANLFTELGNFHAKREGWNIKEIFEELIGAIKRQVWP